MKSGSETHPNALLAFTVFLWVSIGGGRYFPVQVYDYEGAGVGMAMYNTDEVRGGVFFVVYPPSVIFCTW